MMDCIVCGGTMLASYGGGYGDEPDITLHYCTQCHSVCDHEMLGDDRHENWDADYWIDPEGWFCTMDEPWLWTYDADPRPVCPKCWGGSFPNADTDHICNLCWGKGRVHRDTFSDFVTGTRHVSARSIFGLDRYWKMLTNGELEGV